MEWSTGMHKKYHTAFLSYAPFSSEAEQGRVAELCNRLSTEVHVQTGKKFEIYQDRSGARPGEGLSRHAERALGEATFFIPVITRDYFANASCREELKTFLKRQSGRGDFVFPIYYDSAPELDDEKQREKDALAKEIASRRYLDWRELRFEPFNSNKVMLALSQLAVQIRDAMRDEPARGPSPARARDAATTKSMGESSMPSRRLSAKTDLQTIIVAPSGGDYATISSAIEMAVPGARIVVRPGEYREGLVITKPLEIIGEGDRNEIVVIARGQDALLFKTNLGRVSNLTLRQAGGGDWFGVDIAQGRLELEACDITSRSLACVAIHGGADPRLRRNRIHGGKEAGIFIFEGGQGIIEDNDVSGNRGGIAISGGSNPALRRNRIHRSKEEGVFVYEDGQGLFEDNEIFRNRYSGVEVTEGGNPTLRRNRIYGNNESGIYVHGGGLGIIEGNEIFGSAVCEVTIKTGGDPTVRGNVIRGSKGSGVYVGEGGLGTIENNDIIENATSGVELAGGACSTLRRNRIHRNKYVAVWAYKGGGGEIEDNDLRENAKGAWDVSADSQSQVASARNKEA
jgi:parallel beta-helix repeat protein